MVFRIFLILKTKSSLFSPYLIYFLTVMGQGPIIIKRKRKSDLRWQVFGAALAVCQCSLAHGPAGLRSGDSPQCPHVYRVPYSASACQLPKRFVTYPSLEVLKNGTKHPSFQSGFDAVLLIRRNRLDFSVKVRGISLKCS